MFRTIVGGYFVEYLRRVFQGAKAMQEAGWHPQLRSLERVQLSRDMLPIGWGPLRMSTATSNSDPRTTHTNLPWAKGGIWKCIPRNVPSSPTPTGYLARRLRLRFPGEQPIAPCLGEISSRVGKSLRNN